MAEEEVAVKATLRDELTGPLRKVKKGVKDVGDETKKADKEARTYENTLGKLARSGAGVAGVLGRGLATAAKVGALAVGAAAVGVGVLSLKLISLASDAAETASKFDTVFGDQADAVSKWVKQTNAAYGITTKELQDVTSRFGVFGQAAGIAADKLPAFSTELATAGLDLASFYNIDPEEAFLALSSGLAGEAEPLRKFGIFLSDATMKAKASQMGLTGELTESQKVMVRQSLILESLGKAEGDLERTKDSLANKTRALKGRFSELGTMIGTALLPVAGKLVGWLEGRLAPIVTKLTDEAPAMAAALTRGDYDEFVGRIDRVAGAGGRLLDTYRRLRDGWADVTDGWADGGISGAVAGFDEAVGAGGRIEAVFDKVVEVGRDLLTIWRDGLAPALEDLGPAVGIALSPLSALDDVLGFLADNAEVLSPLIGALAAGYAVYAVTSTAASVGQWALNAATAANPYVAAAVAIAAIAAGVYLLWKNNKKARPVIVAVGIALGLMFAWPLMAIGALVAGVILAYKKVDWFRSAVDAVARFLKGAFVAAVGFVRAALTRLVEGFQSIWRASEPVRSLIAAIGRLGFAVLELAITAVRKGLEWLWDKAEPVRSILSTIGSFGLSILKGGIKWLVDTAQKLWDKLEPVREVLSTIGGMALETFKSAIEWITDKVDKLTGFVDDLLGKLNGGTVDVASAVGEAVGNAANGGGVSTVAPGREPPGDTPRPRAGHRGHSVGRNLGHTLATYGRLDAGTPGRRRITSAVRGHSLGSPRSDHVTGRALDIQGSGLNGLARRIREEGGFAEHHGSGGARHLHAAIGDTPRPRAGGGSGSGGMSVTFAPGSIVVQNPAADVDVERAVRRALAEAEREHAERGARS